MERFDAVIFDWAGTTVDYGCFAPVKAFQEVFRHFEVEATMDEVREPMGMLKWDHIRTMLHMPRIHDLWKENYGREPKDSDVDAMYEMFEPLLLEMLKDYAELKPYVKETAAAIRERGLKIGSTTGYTDIMMEQIVPIAKARGYDPDCWYSPDAVDSMGRPYPYMIFLNMKTLKLENVERIVKVGDTLSDIREAKNAGVYAVGILEGSSLVGLSKEELDTLSENEREEVFEKARQQYLEAGADEVIFDIRGVIDIIDDVRDEADHSGKKSEKKSEKASGNKKSRIKTILAEELIINSVKKKKKPKEKDREDKSSKNKKKKEKKAEKKKNKRDH